MNNDISQWPYLVQRDNRVIFDRSDSLSPLGDYCGEWGSHLDETNQAIGVRIMDFYHYITDEYAFLNARNTIKEKDDLIVLFDEPHLPKIEGIPYLPVYRCTNADGQQTLQLSGYPQT